jgi:hypothetical protein
MRAPFYLSLGVEIAREQENALGVRRLSEFDLLRGMGRARARIALRNRWIAFISVGLAVVVASAVLVNASRIPALGRSADGVSANAVASGGFGRWFNASASAPKEVNFSDGSSAKLRPGSGVRLLRTDSHGASVVLESGSLDLRVAGSDWTEYLVGAGPFSVAINLGQAEVSWNHMDELLRLVVREGHVVVSGCQFGVGRKVTAGNELAANCAGR